jgi:hypothetical protein
MMDRPSASGGIFMMYPPAAFAAAAVVVVVVVDFAEIEKCPTVAVARSATKVDSNAAISVEEDDEVFGGTEFDVISFIEVRVHAG